MRPMGRRVYIGLTWLFVIGLLIQVFLAGRGVFDDPTVFGTHRDFGYMLTAGPVLLFIVGLAFGLGRRLAALAVIVFLLFILQSILVGARDSSPAIAALHPVNGFLILLIAIDMAREAWLARVVTTA
jgi:hypothetical protein